MKGRLVDLKLIIPVKGQQVVESFQLRFHSHKHITKLVFQTQEQIQFSKQMKQNTKYWYKWLKYLNEQNLLVLGRQGKLRGRQDQGDSKINTRLVTKIITNFKNFYIHNVFSLFTNLAYIDGGGWVWFRLQPLRGQFCFQDDVYKRKVSRDLWSITEMYNT